MTLPPETQQVSTPSAIGPRWRTLPLTAQLYIAVIILSGIGGLWAFFPHTFSRPVMFAVLIGRNYE